MNNKIYLDSSATYGRIPRPVLASIVPYITKTQGNGSSLYSIELHRFLLNIERNSKIIVDHINTHHPEDNRKANLRIVTQSENNMNRKLAINNKSGVVGVCWDKNNNCWLAQIGFDSQKIRLGYFKNKEDAIKARKEAEEKYFGEHSYDNSQKQWKENFGE